MPGTTRPAPARALNHVAYPTFDTEATRRFYTEILGFPLVAAVRGDWDPEARAKRPHLHTFFAMAGGEVIAFFEVEGVEPPPKDSLPTWVRHIALSVESADELLRWRAWLEQNGVAVTPVVDHDGVWKSIYFQDPNGVLLELTWQARPLGPADAERARELVGAWQRRKAGGSPEG